MGTRTLLLRWSSSRAGSSLHGKRFDAVIVGGGHNGLVAVSIYTRDVMCLRSCNI